MDFDYRGTASDLWHRSTVEKRQKMLMDAGIKDYTRCACRGFDFLPVSIQDALRNKFELIIA